MRNVIPKGAILVPKNAKRVFQGILYDTYHWEQKLYDGSTKTFEMLKRFDTVKTIAIKDNKIVILFQEQPNHPLFYDIPGGWHDHKQENELEAAKRELLEETGMTFKNWKLLEVTQPHSKIEQFVYIFLATDFMAQAKPHLDAGEKIEVKLVTINDVKELAESQKNRYLPKHIFERAKTVNDILKLPAYEP